MQCNVYLQNSNTNRQNAVPALGIQMRILPKPEFYARWVSLYSTFKHMHVSVYTISLFLSIYLATSVLTFWKKGNEMPEIAGKEKITCIIYHIKP